MTRLLTTLTAFSTAMRGLIAPVVRDLRAAHPDLTVSLTEREPWDTVDLVASGQSDLGVIHRWGDVPIAVPDHLTSTVVARDVADVVVHRDHRLAGRELPGQRPAGVQGLLEARHVGAVGEHPPARTSRGPPRRPVRLQHLVEVVGRLSPDRADEPVADLAPGAERVGGTTCHFSPVLAMPVTM